MGCVGMGTVLHLVYPSHTAYPYHGVMGIDRYFLQFSAYFYGIPNALLLFMPHGNLAFPPQVICCLIWAAFSYLHGTHSSSSTLMSPCLYYWCQWSPLSPSSSQIDICAIATLTGKAINCEVEYRCKGRDPGQGRVSELTIIMCCLN